MFQNDALKLAHAFRAIHFLWEELFYFSVFQELLKEELVLRTSRTLQQCSILDKSNFPPTQF